DELSFANVKLTGSLSSFIHPFLGILPIRDDPDLGEEIRYVFPSGPAAAAGLKPWYHIMKIGLGDDPLLSFSGRDELTSVLDQLQPGVEIKLEVTRKGAKEPETIKLKLGVLSEVVPDKLSDEATRRQALATKKTAPAAKPRPGRQGPGTPPKRPGSPKDDAKKGDPQPAEKPKKDEDKKVETGLLKRATQAGDHDYWLYVPEDYDANVAYALVIWLHPAGKGKDKDTETMINSWEDFCSENHMLLLCPRAESETGWLASEV